MNIQAVLLSFFITTFCFENNNSAMWNNQSNKFEIRTILLPEGDSITAFLLNKAQKDSMVGNSSIERVNLENYGIYGHNEELFLQKSNCIVKQSNNDFLFFNGIQDYIKVVQGKDHYNSLIEIMPDRSLRICFNMLGPSIKTHLATKKYRIDDTSYPSKHTTENGGYKVYFFEDGSVGYFYLFEPNLGRYMGWWHESLETFEWFYHNVYELTEVYPNNNNSRSL